MVNEPLLTATALTTPYSALPTGAALYSKASQLRVVRSQQGQHRLSKRQGCMKCTLASLMLPCSTLALKRGDKTLTVVKVNELGAKSG